MLDAVQSGLSLGEGALAASRAVLAAHGNMSSATIMFVLADMLETASPGQRGLAMAFGPGMVAETFRFTVALMDLSVRAELAELMDAPELDEATYQRCLHDLAAVNRVTFTHRPTLRWLAHATRDLAPGATLSVLDVAYGEGDLLRAIAHWAEKRGFVRAIIRDRSKSAQRHRGARRNAAGGEHRLSHRRCF